MSHKHALKGIRIQSGENITKGFARITGISERTRGHLCQRFRYSIPLFRRESQWTIVDHLRSAAADYLSTLTSAEHEEVEREIKEAVPQIIAVLISNDEQRAAVYNLWLAQSTQGYKKPEEEL